MAKAPKLKVYCTAIGFYDALVAAPSQRAALNAWGTTTDLFAAGRVSVVEDEAQQAEALAHPGEVIKRLRGDEQAILAEIDREDRASPAKPKQKAKPAPARKAAPDRSELDRAEQALADAERELAERLDAIAAERASLNDREAVTRKEGEARIRDLGRTRERLKAAYDRAVERTGTRR